MRCVCQPPASSTGRRRRPAQPPASQLTRSLPQSHIKNAQDDVQSAPTDKFNTGADDCAMEVRPQATAAARLCCPPAARRAAQRTRAHRTSTHTRIARLDKRRTPGSPPATARADPAATAPARRAVGRPSTGPSARPAGRRRSRSGPRLATSRSWAMRWRCGRKPLKKPLPR